MQNQMFDGGFWPRPLPNVVAPTLDPQCSGHDVVNQMRKKVTDSHPQKWNLTRLAVEGESNGGGRRKAWLGDAAAPDDAAAAAAAINSRSRNANWS